MSTRKRILVVEDELINQEILNVYLYKLYKLDFADKLEDAVIFIDKQSYAFIITDIRLGHRLDGLSVLKHARSSEHNANTPVIAYTSSETSVDQRTFIEEGFDAVVNKPSKQEYLLGVLETF